MRVIVDRFEGDFAVCEKENLEMIDISKDKLSPEIKEGDILIVNGDNIRVDHKKTTERKDKMENLMNRLLK